MANKPKIKIPLQYGPTPKISPTGKQPNQPIFVSTPEGKNIWEDMAGLYYRVKEKLERLNNKLDFSKGEDGRILEGICVKFERDNRISADDMRECNELWGKYGKK